MPEPLNMPVEIAHLLPHGGDMVLIDRLVAFDDLNVHCRAVIDDTATHPLAAAGRLPAIVLVEYAAQAMAVHGGLFASAGENPRAGMLVALGRLDLACEYLETRCELDIHAKRLCGDDYGQIYSFLVSTHDRVLAEGQVTIMIPEA